MNRISAFLITALAFSSPAAAQLSVTTIGATDAAQCYQNALSQFSDDTGPCNAALRDRATTKNDRKKTLVNRGIIFNRLNELNAAHDDFNAALDIDSELAEAWLNRGNSFFLGGRYDDALSNYERALALDVAKPWAAWYNIGLVHDAKNQPEEARAAYKQALTLNPDFTLAQNKLEERD